MTGRKLSFGSLLALIVGAIFFFGGKNIMAADQTVFIGNYSNDPTPEMTAHHLDKAEGIYAADYDSQTGGIQKLRLAYKIASPNFFALSPDKKRLYTIGEKSITGFQIDPKTGGLTLINRVRTDSALGYCHLAVSPDGRFLVASDYPAGNFDFYPLQADGSVGELIDRFHRPGGGGPDKKRQNGPYGHAGYFIQGDDGVLRAFLVDLGSDRVSVVDVDKQSGKVTPDSDIPEMTVPAGHGARHLAWTQNEDGSYYFFITNEMGSTVTFYRVRFGQGKEGLRLFGTFPTLPEDLAGKTNWEQEAVDNDPNLLLANATAEIAYRPGRAGNPPTVYVSNRGHDSIAVFRVVEAEGQPTLQAIQFQSSLGKFPRYFEISPDGNYLIVCNKKSGSVDSFKIADDGTLTPSGQPPVWTAWPCALAFVPKE